MCNLEEHKIIWWNTTCCPDCWQQLWNESWTTIFISCCLRCCWIWDGNIQDWTDCEAPQPQMKTGKSSNIHFFHYIEHGFKLLNKSVKNGWGHGNQSSERNSSWAASRGQYEITSQNMNLSFSEQDHVNQVWGMKGDLRSCEWMRLFRKGWIWLEEKSGEVAYARLNHLCFKGCWNFPKSFAQSKN